MNINFKLTHQVEEKLNAIIQEKLSGYVDELFKDEQLLESIVKEVIKGQLKSNALQMIQSPELRTKICQKIYPIVYKELGV